jgi:hypothetical protein
MINIHWMRPMTDSPRLTLSINISINVCLYWTWWTNGPSEINELDVIMETIANAIPMPFNNERIFNVLLLIHHPFQNYWVTFGCWDLVALLVALINVTRIASILRQQSSTRPKASSSWNSHANRILVRKTLQRRLTSRNCSLRSAQQHPRAKSLSDDHSMVATKISFSRYIQARKLNRSVRNHWEPDNRYSCDSSKSGKCRFRQLIRPRDTLRTAAEYFLLLNFVIRMAFDQLQTIGKQIFGPVSNIAIV